MISGLDIVIPAHYHGATVGVTIAFMGMTYYLLPRLGFAACLPGSLSGNRCCTGVDELLAVLGLAWTGGYGVQRKTAGLAQGVERLEEIAGMGLIGAFAGWSPSQAVSHSWSSHGSPCAAVTAAVMDILLFTLNAIVIYLLTDWIVRALDLHRGVALKYRQLVFFIVFLALAMLTFSVFSRRFMAGS